MKKLLFLLIACVALVSCEKRPIEEAPSLIPGMGEAEGELEVIPFELSEDFELIGTIAGTLESDISAGNSDFSFKSTDGIETYSRYGCGGKYVKLKMTFKNRSTIKRTLYFKRGLLCKVNNEDTQHGILVQPTWLCFKGGETRTVYLNMLCVNKGKSGAKTSDKYQILGYTTSKIMNSLLKRLSVKKCNFEHFYRSSLKSAGTDDLVYDNVEDVLQEAVWALTNGSGLTEEQSAFIDNLPALEEGTYPEGIVEEYSELPVYFEEYAVE